MIVFSVRGPITTAEWRLHSAIGKRKLDDIDPTKISIVDIQLNHLGVLLLAALAIAVPLESIDRANHSDNEAMSHRRQNADTEGVFKKYPR